MADAATVGSLRWHRLRAFPRKLTRNVAVPAGLFAALERLVVFREGPSVTIPVRDCSAPARSPANGSSEEIDDGSAGP